MTVRESVRMSMCVCVYVRMCVRVRDCVNMNDDGDEDDVESTYRMMTREGSYRK